MIASTSFFDLATDALEQSCTVKLYRRNITTHQWTEGTDFHHKLSMSDTQYKGWESKWEGV